MDDENDVLRHLTGCPNDGDAPDDPDGRVERFEAGGADGKVEVLRCKQCGAQVILPATAAGGAR